MPKATFWTLLFSCPTAIRRTPRRFLKGRVAIPLHDADARLVGYAGRIVDDAEIGEDNPRYKFPGTREREGKLLEFRKTLFLYNGFRFKTPLDELIVVEGFTAVWWLHQSGLPHVVGVMGSDCSEKQGELIVSLVKPTGQVWLCPDRRRFQGCGISSAA